MTLPTIAGGWRAILADPPWRYEARGPTGYDRAPTYDTMNQADILALPVADIAAPDAALFLWGVWMLLPQALEVIAAWGFVYKTAAFIWVKADLSQMDLFAETAEAELGLGYWVRQASEYCLLATRGAPRRLSGGVRQAIIARRREHSRKPAVVHERIEALVEGPYLELFARERRPGWAAWGNECDAFDVAKPHSL